jgi:hypothetical protein
MLRSQDNVASPCQRFRFVVGLITIELIVLNLLNNHQWRCPEVRFVPEPVNSCPWLKERSFIHRVANFDDSLTNEPFPVRYDGKIACIFRSQ